MRPLRHRYDLSVLDALPQRTDDAMKVLLSMVFEAARTLSFTH